MPAPKRQVRKSTADTEHSLMRAYWRGDPPPAGALSAEDRQRLIAARYFAEGRSEYAKAGCEFAAGGQHGADHPHTRAWAALISTEAP